MSTGCTTSDDGDDSLALAAALLSGTSGTTCGLTTTSGTTLNAGGLVTLSSSLQPLVFETSTGALRAMAMGTVAVNDVVAFASATNDLSSGSLTFYTDTTCPIAQSTLVSPNPFTLTTNTSTSLQATVNTTGTYGIFLGFTGTSPTTTIVTIQKQ